MRRINLSDLESVVLLVCGSARYDQGRGPSVAGLVVDIRLQLGQRSALAATRISIDLRHRLYFNSELLEDGGQSTLGEVLHNHVAREAGNRSTADAARTLWVWRQSRLAELICISGEPRSPICRPSLP